MDARRRARRRDPPAAALLSRLTLALAAGLLLVASAASAARPLPSWTAYRGDRAVALAWRAIAEQRIDDAVVHAERAAELQPEEVESWHVLCRARMAKGAWTEAHDAVLALRRLAPDEPAALELLGRTAVELGDRDQAHEAFSALDGLQATLPGPRVGLALVAARLDGDHAGAITHLEVALARDPALDLSALLLRPHWRPLADDAAFVEALSALLQR